MQKKLTNLQRLYHFFCFPILAFFSLYLMFVLLSYLIKGEFVTLSDKVIEISASALGISIAHWIGLFYPSKPRNEAEVPKKSLKEYVKQYVMEGTPFNKLVLLIYLCSIIVILLIVLLMIIGYL